MRRSEAGLSESTQSKAAKGIQLLRQWFLGGAMRMANARRRSFSEYLKSARELETLESRLLLTTDGISVTATQPVANEGGPNPIVFRLQRPIFDATSAVDINYAFSGLAQLSNATYGTDYTSIGMSGVLTIPAGVWYVNVSATPIEDALVEDIEYFKFSFVANDSNNSAGFAIGSIEDNDGPPQPPPTVSISSAGDPNAAEQNSDPGTFIVSRSGGNLSTALTVSFNVGGTATHDSSGFADYNSFGNSVTIEEGQTTATLTVTPNEDSESEPVESVIVTLTGSSGGYVVANAGTPTDNVNYATVNITDNDLNQPPISSLHSWNGEVAWRSKESKWRC